MKMKNRLTNDSGGLLPDSVINEMYQAALKQDPDYEHWLDEELDMKIGEMKESKYLKKEDVGDGINVTIQRIDRQDVSLENQPEELKYILYFQEAINGHHKGMVMNWTNIQLCAMAAGTEETDEWVGKQIQLYNDPTISFGGKITGGIRIRPVEKPGNQTPSSQTTPVQSENPGAGMDDKTPF